MAIVKHTSSKNSNYNDAVDYLVYKHNESTNAPVLDRNGDMIPRDEYYIEGINCTPETFAIECQELNRMYGKNSKPGDVKAHQYIISFDPKDVEERGLTGEKAQELGLEFAKKNFPGHQVLVCTHTDGHHESGNIHVHIILNSLRKYDVPAEDAPFAERANDLKAGFKHHCTKDLLNYYKADVMQMCQRESLNQVDLLHKAGKTQSEPEYYVRYNGQKKADKEGKETPFETQKDYLRNAIDDASNTAKSQEEFEQILHDKYKIEVSFSRGAITYKHPDRDKNIRGRSLGANYEAGYLNNKFKDNAEGKAKHQQENIGWDPESGKDKYHRPHEYDPKNHDYQADPITALYINSGIRLVTDIQANMKAALEVRQMMLTLPRDRKGEYDPVDVQILINKQSDIRDETQEKLDNVRAQLKDINAQLKEEYEAEPRDYNVINPLRAQRDELNSVQKDLFGKVRMQTAIVSQIRVQSKIGYERAVKALDTQAKLAELRMMAKTVCWVQEHGYDTVEKIHKVNDTAKMKREIAQMKYNDLNKEYKNINKAIGLAGKYLSTKNVYNEFLNAKNKGAFRKQHESEIGEHERVVRELKKMYPDSKIPSMKALKTEKEEIYAKRDDAYQELKYYKAQSKDLETITTNIDTIIQEVREQTGEGKAKEHEETREYGPESKENKEHVRETDTHTERKGR